ncbi:DsbC family protein [Ottowia sp. GY511]|uniref:Thiol:disulfide interchange protein n=1 Tax=Ottowia flava TaxID=2675430 RepID=A0ABW4KXR8_9BURK|nr:DsbC family protein [Ottowia sp. GY511]TXK22503.1 DsbC family protein [Ottowia sp. GY511]
MTKNLIRRAALTVLLALPLLATAQDKDFATLKKNLGERIPGLSQIDEVRKTPMAGLFEVRVGNDILYTDAEGNFLLHGNLLDTRSRKNLTEERVEKLTAIKWDELDTKNAITIVRGNGKRKMAVFEDPNCGYCKRFEKDMQKVNNVTVHMFLIPILGQDSVEKSKQIWCSADKAKAWHDWMQRDVAPKGASTCNTDALAANLDFAKKYRITGTPTIVFADGSRVPGAINAQQVEQQLGR